MISLVMIRQKWETERDWHNRVIYRYNLYLEEIFNLNLKPRAYVLPILEEKPLPNPRFKRKTHRKLAPQQFEKVNMHLREEDCSIPSTWWIQARRIATELRYGH